MSWDLLVALHDPPAELARERAFTVGAPVSCEAEDLPDALAALEPAPRFLVELNVPTAASDADRARALELAQRWAEAFRGAVYDPQEDAVVWPEHLRAAATTTERIRVVVLSWYLAGAPCRPDAANVLLDELRASVPEMVPRRWGDVEPLQHRFEATGDDGFIEQWWRSSTKGHGGWLFWKAQPPCFEGSASFPDPRDPVAIPGTRRCTVISTSLDGRVLERDETTREAIVDLLPRMATRLGAVYAAAHVQRNVIAKRGSLWYDDDSERVPMPMSWFAGLPPGPTWLAWFGPDYAPLVDGAPWFRGGPAPMDADHLAGRFPAIPDRLRFRTRDDAPLGQPRILAAAHIPFG